MILFESIRWKNFLSTGGQFTEVFLNKSPTTLIIGENGSGKSTILDALCFSLFNKPFRSINKPQLINSINQKECRVEVEFSIGSKKYKVVRGIKPSVFEIYLNEELLNQDAASRDYQQYLEEHVLKLNYKSFTQVVILGSATFVPFMQLSAAARRDIIEDLLDIKVFSIMNDVLKVKTQEIKSQIADIDSQIELTKTKVELQQKLVKTLEEDKQKKVEDVQKRISESSAEITKLNASVASEKKKETSFQSSILDSKEKRSKRSEMESLLRKLTEKIKTQEKSIAFYEQHDVCPTCSQNLDDVHKEQTIASHTHKMEEVQSAIGSLTKELQAIETRLDEIAAIEEEISQCKENIIELNSKIIAEQNYIKKLTQELETQSVQGTNVKDEKDKIKELAKQVVSLTEKRYQVVEEKNYLDLASLLLKDTGIKTKIIKQYLPVMNKIINKYLQVMDFFVHFELDEAFNETIKSRHRDEFSYASFSEGEKQRIDLALLFAWRTIAKMKNSANTNLLMLDEVFDSSLDSGGADQLYQILGTLDSSTNTFVISHRDQMFDKFRSVIKFQKQQNFSTIVR